MEEAKKWKLVLKFENQQEEETKDHIYYPLYLNSYEEGIRNIYMGLLREEEKRKECDGKFDYIHQDNASNIIAFLGGRGTGKSTAMNEFCHILESLNNNEKCRWWLDCSIEQREIREKLYSKKLLFKVINIIEASNLEDKEDLFELILASIFREYERNVENGKHGFEEQQYRKAEMLKLFNEILSGYYAIKNVRNEEFGDSYISKLKYMSSSMDIRKKVKRLIDKLFEEFYGHPKDYFLVIAIDDLDLNIAHGYEMLEQIHKYFFLPNILIVLSADYDQIHYICKYHYVKEFSGGKSHVTEADVLNQCSELSKDYFTKVFPIDLRVYMPDLQKMSRKIVVEDNIRLKYFLMRKVAEKMNIYYDPDGLKFHFVEANTVRELVHYNQFLESLASINFEEWDNETDTEKQNEYMNFYDKNHEQFNLDIQNRLANNLLSDSQKKLFSSIMNKSLEKRAKEVWGIMKTEVGSKNSLFGWEETAYEEENYAYGDLIQGIYEYGRLSGDKKALIKCILASFTSEMVREKISYTKNRNDSARAHSLMRLNKFLGNSVGNSWLGEMVPQMEQLNEEASLGYNATIEDTRLKISFGMESEILINPWKYSKNEKYTRKEIQNFLSVLHGWVKMKRIIPTLECMAVFLTPRTGNKEWIEFDVDIAEEKEASEPYSFVFKGRKQRVVFDILGFVKKSIDCREKIKIFQDNLASKMTSVLIHFLTDQKKADRKMVLSVALENMLRAEVSNMIYTESMFYDSEWEEDCAAFPFYDLDLAYNALKRTRRELIEENPGSIKSDECYKYVKRAYEKLIDVLGRQDRRYQQNGVELKNGETLANYPFINVFLNAETKLTSDFAELFGKNISDILFMSETSKVDEPEGEKRS